MEVLRQLFLLGLCSVASIASSQTDTLRKGDVLSSSESPLLVSAGKVFILEFFTPEETNRTYLAVRFTTRVWGGPVWIGNRETPLPANSSPKLLIDASGRLKLTHDEDPGSPYLLSSNRTSSNVAATLLDSGNFVLREINPDGSYGRELWSSFDNPTDTLLPGMKVGIDHRSGRNWSLKSWLRNDTPAAGAFSLEWEPSKRRLVIKYRGVVHWTSGELKNATHFQYQPTQISIYDDVHMPQFVNVSTKEEEYFGFNVILDPSDVTYLSREERLKVALAFWRLDPQGLFFVTYNGTVIADVGKCYGYENETQQSKGCELWEQPICSRGSGHTFVQTSGSFVSNTEFGGKQAVGFTTHNSNATLSDCREICWNDCQCVGYGSYDEGSCTYWMGTDLRIRQDNTETSVTMYVLDSSIKEGSDSNSTNKWIKIVIPTVLAVIFILLLGLFQFSRRKRKQARKEKELKDLFTLEGYTDIYEVDEGENITLKVFSYAWIVATTNNFSCYHKLGQGGFGSVYKGVTPKGQEVAIKQLSERSGQGIMEFKNEVVLIAKLQHTNLVKLLGICIHGDQKMLVYEFMPNKSLDLFLFDPNQKEQLTWEKRINIIEGIAQGLLYLHKYSRVRIIHRDMKASNILLDENMNPKISDFGMAKILRKNATEAKSKKFGGTRGYMAPEYARKGIFSTNSDVYSFGVLVLEIVSGKKNNYMPCEDGPLNLVDHAWKLWNQDAVLHVVDPALSNMRGKEEELYRCINVGLLCVEDRAVDRPSMSDVISMLTNENMALPKPKKPAFVSSCSVSNEFQEDRLEKFSANELSISAVEPR